MNNSGDSITYFKPLPGMFREHAQSEVHFVLKRQKYVGHIFDHVEYPKAGGVLTHYKGRIFPEKGMPYPEAIGAMDKTKKMMRALTDTLTNKWAIPSLIGFACTPWRGKIQLMDSYLAQYCVAAELEISQHYLLKRFYCPAAKEIKTWSYLFLKNLGFSKFVYEKLSDIIMFFIQYDNVYRYRLQDLFAAVTKEDFLKDPRKWIKFIAELYTTREIAPAVQKRGQAIAKVLNLILLVPKVKHAFVSAMSHVDFGRLGPDDGDRYQCMTANNYNYMGVEAKLRQLVYINMHLAQGELPPVLEVGG